MGDDEYSGGVCVNPACNCDPCRCERPCTCGLTPTGRSRHEEWDPERNEYRTADVVAYRPTIPLVPPSPPPTGPSSVHGDHGTHPISHGGNSSHPVDDHAAHAASNPDTRPVTDLAAAMMEFGAGTEALNEVYARGAEVAAIPAHPHESRSIRTAEHNGHQIEIITTYELRIDGERLRGHLGVNADGTVHYHGMPNYSTSSAIDLAREIIETFPDDYGPAPSSTRSA